MGEAKDLDVRVQVFYENNEWKVSPDATEKQIRDTLSKDFPEVANARFEKDAETGNWTITKEAGQKGE